MTVISFDADPLDQLKRKWGIYDVVVRMPDGTEVSGTMQGDTHEWLFETFEANEEPDTCEHGFATGCLHCLPRGDFWLSSKPDREAA